MPSLTSYLAALTLLSTTALSTPTTQAKNAFRGSKGCGKPHDIGYQDASPSRTIISSNINRTYGIYVPKSYATDTRTPRRLIFDYHGNNGTPLNQYNNSQYYNYPEGESYLAVYPAGVNKSWQSAPYAEKGVDDLQFTTDLLAYISEEYCVDLDHVYASGKSNGGGFVDFLACSDAGDAFAAFAMASAALYSDNSLNDGTCGQQKRAILESHGANDTTISYFGGERNNGTLPDIRTWIGWWALRDGCTDAKADAQVSGDLGGYETVKYSCGGFEDVVQHYDVYKLGHCWPSKTGDNSDGARSYCGDHSLDYTPVVLEFFDQWDLRKAEKLRGEGWKQW